MSQYPPNAQQADVALPLVFSFNGGALSYFGMQILAALVTTITLGICYPWAVVMQYRWKANHTTVNGAQMRFTGSAAGLFGHWIKWLLLSIITAGIYSFWVVPRMTKWIIEHQQVSVPLPVVAGQPMNWR
jgi:uncharacterized membrane protein YjgN (DUF898 family)